MFVTQAILVGNLSQYFCEKNSLEEELSVLRNNGNDTELINSKREEIQGLTRNAYLYAMGMSIIAVGLAMDHAWTFYLSGTLGMRHRILFTAAIYEKVRNTYIPSTDCKKICSSITNITCYTTGGVQLPNINTLLVKSSHKYVVFTEPEIWHVRLTTCS